MDELFLGNVIAISEHLARMSIQMKIISEDDFEQMKKGEPKLIAGYTCYL